MSNNDYRLSQRFHPDRDWDLIEWMTEINSQYPLGVRGEKVKEVLRAGIDVINWLAENGVAPPQQLGEVEQLLRNSNRQSATTPIENQEQAAPNFDATQLMSLIQRTVEIAVDNAIRKIGGVAGGGNAQIPQDDGFAALAERADGEWDFDEM